jgi:hypothetical protein
MELFALESKKSGGQTKLCPLYFCRAVGGEHTAKILTCTLLFPYPSSFRRLISLLDVKDDVSSGHDQAFDNAYKCDSDVETGDEETSEHTETVNKNKFVQAGRLAPVDSIRLAGVNT